jgi:hypothetical protein
LYISPTNIAMGLLGALAAHDLGFLGRDELAERVAHMLDTLDRMEKYRGHLLNWYDTRDLAPLLPRYVSTVDSGNLAGALWALSAGLREVAPSPFDPAPTCAAAAENGGCPPRRHRAIRRSAGGGRRRFAACAPARRRIDPPHFSPRAKPPNAGSLPRMNPCALSASAWRNCPLPRPQRKPSRGPSCLQHDISVRAGAAGTAARLVALADRADAAADAMQFGFLFDRDRRIFSVGYRLPDAEGPGGLDPSYYDLLASEARLASFIAIAKGEVPQVHWFQLGRALAPVHGMPTLVSWGGTMFEYLMPHMLMRSYPETLLDLSCRSVVRAQRGIRLPPARALGYFGVGYAVTDHAGNYQYMAFGVPGLGLRRGLTDHLVIAPYATALAAMIDPSAAAANFGRLAASGADGPYGFYEALDFTPGESPAGESHPGESDAGETPAKSSRGQVIRQFLAHHQGISLVSLCNALQGNRMVERFHANPMVQATELLLQERMPRFVPVSRPRPAEASRVVPPQVPVPPRRFRSADTPFPNAQFLSNGRLVTTVTNAGGGAITWSGLAVTRWREDSTCDPGSHFLYLRDVRSGHVWSATHHPMGVETQHYRVLFFPNAPSSTATTTASRRVSRSSCLPKTMSKSGACGCSTSVNASARSKSRAMSSWPWHSLETISRIPSSASSSSKPKPDQKSPRCSAAGAGAAPASRRCGASTCAAAEGRLHGAVEWETDRGRFLGRGRDVGDPQALDGRPLSATTGAVLDPIFALRQRIRLQPGEFARLSFVTGVAPETRRGARPGRQVLRPTVHGAHLRARGDPVDARRAAFRSEHGRGAAVRAAGIARPVRGWFDARSSRRTDSQRARTIGPCGDSASLAICRSCSCASSRATTAVSCARCCERRSTGASKDCAPTSCC